MVGEAKPGATPALPLSLAVNAVVLGMAAILTGTAGEAKPGATSALPLSLAVNAVVVGMAALVVAVVPAQRFASSSSSLRGMAMLPRCRHLSKRTVGEKETLPLVDRRECRLDRLSSSSSCALAPVELVDDLGDRCRECFDDPEDDRSEALGEEKDLGDCREGQEAEASLLDSSFEEGLRSARRGDAGKRRRKKRFLWQSLLS